MQALSLSPGDESMSRILLLASRVPYPIGNGEDLRIYHLAKELSARHEIHLVAYGEAGSLPDEARACFEQIHLVSERGKVDARRRGLARVLDAFLPSLMYAFDDRIDRLLKELMKDHQFDRIWIPAWPMMPYCWGLPLERVILDVMDDGVLELLRETRHSQSPAQLLVNLKRLFVVYLFERKYFSRVGCCSLVTDTDEKALRKVCPAANAVTIPNGVDTEYFSPMDLPEDYPSLIFEGNMSFGPSVDAICYFHSEIFPSIKRQLPETKLWIVGKDPAQAVLDLRSDDVTVTGFVDDVRPYLDRASLFICPMRKGAGIKNKLLQAWAMGKAVVATPIALAGLRAEAGLNIAVGDSAQQFSSEVLRLLNDRAARDSLGERGRKTALELYGWSRQAELFEAQMEIN